MAKAKWPTRWLMTDERMGDALFRAIDRLPEGSGIVFRHYSLDAQDRQSLGQRVAERAQSRELMLAVSRDEALAYTLGAALVHNPQGPCTLPWTRSVHSVAEAEAAAGAALVFVSPLHATRSHPRAPTLDRERASAILLRLACPAIALGGMDEARFAAIRDWGFAGWAGIDAWL